MMEILMMSGFVSGIIVGLVVLYLLSRLRSKASHRYSMTIELHDKRRTLDETFTGQDAEEIAEDYLCPGGWASAVIICDENGHQQRFSRWDYDNNKGVYLQ